MIYKHNKLKLPFYIGLSGVYIILKYSITPFLYLLQIFGYNSNLPRGIDSKINRAILPLTENPDDKERMEIKTRLYKGASLPPLPIYFSDGSSDILNSYANSPLLLIFIRGSWCSYSRLHLSDIISKKEIFANAGIELIAVTSYKDQDWWHSKGIDIKMIIDTRGEIFKSFGIQVNSWIEFAWGRILPHEGAFLFDVNGKLVAYDVRKVNSIVPGQRFLSAEKWLDISLKYL